MQHQTHPKCRTGARLTAVSAAVLGVLALAAAPAQAMEFDTGNPDLEVRWDNTVRYNLGTRTGERNKSGIGNNPTFDEGEFRFDNGDVVANRFDLLSEFDLVYQQKYGFRVSAAGWYDNAYSDGKARRNPAIPQQHSRLAVMLTTTTPLTPTATTPDHQARSWTPSHLAPSTWRVRRCR